MGGEKGNFIQHAMALFLAAMFAMLGAVLDVYVGGFFSDRSLFHAFAWYYVWFIGGYLVTVFLSTLAKQ